MSDILISEIFGPTIQGEGALIGAPTVFIRTAGCDFRCSWCDTLFAVDKKYRDSWQRLSVEHILNEVAKLTDDQPILITLSGGNPALQPLAALLEQGKQGGHRFALETQGSVYKPWFAELDYLTLSPKPPSAATPFDADTLASCLQSGASHTCLKIVIDDVADLHWAKALAEQSPQTDVYLQPCNPLHRSTQSALSNQQDNDNSIKNDLARLEQLQQWCNDIHWYRPRILPQLHRLLWGDQRGV